MAEGEGRREGEGRWREEGGRWGEEGGRWGKEGEGRREEGGKTGEKREGWRAGRRDGFHFPYIAKSL